MFTISVVVPSSYKLHVTHTQLACTPPPCDETHNGPDQVERITCQHKNNQLYSVTRD